MSMKALVGYVLGEGAFVTYLVDEDESGLQFDGQGENGGGELLRFAVPLVRQRAGLQIDEAEARLLGRRFGDQRLPATRWPVKQHPCYRDNRVMMRMMMMMLMERKRKRTSNLWGAAAAWSFGRDVVFGRA